MTFNIREPLGVNTNRNVGFRQKDGSKDMYYHSGSSLLYPSGYVNSSNFSLSGVEVTILECENGFIDFFNIFNTIYAATYYTISFNIDGNVDTGNDFMAADGKHNNYILPQYYTYEYFTNGPIYFAKLIITCQITSGSGVLRANYRFSAESVTEAL